MFTAFFARAARNLRVYACFGLLFGIFPALAVVAVAQRAGTPDTSFSGDGIAFTTFPTHNFPAKPSGGVAVQADNKVVISGYLRRTVNPDVVFEDYALARFNADGTLDQSFGTGGKVITDITNSYPEQPAGVAIAPDGKIVVGATSHLFTVLRYNTDGSLDNSFNGGGYAQVGFGMSGALTDIVVQPDGKIIVVGWTTTYVGGNIYRADFSVARFTTGGFLDNTFNDGTGILKFNFDMIDAMARGVALRADGKIVIVGQTQSQGIAVARLNANGTLDTTFDQDGKALISAPNTHLLPWEIAIQPDNKIIVPVSGNTSGVGLGFSLIRLNENGTFDQSFDGDGIVSTMVGGGGTAYEVAVQPDGKIVAGGIANYSPPLSSDFAVVRYHPNGTLDAGFGSGGKAVTDLLGIDVSKSLALAPDGKIVLCGESGFSGFAAVRYYGNSAAGRADVFDYDGDGKADISVFRPSAGDWYISRSSDGAFAGTHFGADGDLIAPADFDGDARTDINVFRPSDGSWYRLNSSDNSFSEVQFGANGDLPVPGDYDGDGKADVSIYRPSAGSWYRLNSSNNQSVGVQFGISEDKPIVGDFDGDGKSDLTVYRPSNGTWYRINSSNDTFSPNQFGVAEDKPVAADYDGDGKTDLAVYRPSVGDWYVINSSNNSFTGIHFGIREDKPAPADFDGDGKADLAVFRPSSGTWYLLRTTAGFTGVQFGASGDIPTPNAFVR